MYDGKRADIIGPLFLFECRSSAAPIYALHHHHAASPPWPLPFFDKLRMRIGKRGTGRASQLLLTWHGCSRAPRRLTLAFSRPIALRSFEGTRAHRSGPGRRCPPTARGYLRRHTCRRRPVAHPRSRPTSCRGIIAGMKRPCIGTGKENAERPEGQGFGGAGGANLSTNWPASSEARRCRLAGRTPWLRHPRASVAKRSATRGSRPECCGRPTALQNRHPFCTLTALPLFFRPGS
jgi:hypothetical protein